MWAYVGLIKSLQQRCNTVGTRTAQGLSTYRARLEPLLPNQIFDDLRFCRLNKTYKADIKIITLNIVSPEKRLLVLEARGHTEAERMSTAHGHGTRATRGSGRSAENVKIMVRAFLAERGVQANSKAWHHAMQSEQIQRMAIAHAQRPK